MKKLKFRIGSSGDMAQELKKALELQLLYIHALFDPAPKDKGLAIHEARRSCKKCRAILRLMRDAMGYASYYRENIGMRDLQREMSQVRDADVQYALFSRLSERHPKYGHKKWFSGIIKNARRDYNQEVKRFFKPGKLADLSGYALSKAAQIQHYELSGQGFELLEGGLCRIYRQGREMGTMVFNQTADANEIHAFRKKAKYLQYQLSYLRTLYKPLLKASIHTLEQLTENLGYYNDLHLTCTRIQEYAEENQLSSKKQQVLLTRLREDMQQTLFQSKQVFEMLYVEKPKHFTKRMGQYWDLYLRNLN